MPRLLNDSPDPYARRFSFPKWSRSVTVLDEPRLFKMLPEFSQWTRDRHRNVSLEYLGQAVAAQRVYHATIRTFERIFGSHGPLISGVIREHFPEWAKDDLRFMCREYQGFADKAHAHHRASGQRSWRGLSDAQLRNGAV